MAICLVWVYVNVQNMVFLLGVLPSLDEPDSPFLHYIPCLASFMFSLVN